MRWSAVITSLGIGLAAPAAALAAGGPVPPVLGHNGVGVAGGSARFVALSAGRSTVVARVTTRGRRIQSRFSVPGHYGIPGADYNGSPTGLSADGGTLVLQPMRSRAATPRTTRLLVLGTDPLRLRRMIILRGWSTVDAISPDGRWLYLVHYQASNISRYEVQAYDLAH